MPKVLRQARGASHTDSGWRCPPESLTVETDPASPFYDESVEYPVPEDLQANITARGPREQVEVVRDGDRYVVVNGRKRVRATIAANEQRAVAGLDPYTISYAIVQTKDDADILGLSGALNLHGTETPMMRARKAQRLSDLGMSKERIANDLGYKTVRAVDDAILLLGCSTKVQNAVDDGVVSPTVARDLAKLPRREQDPALDAMRAAGATKGAPARQAVRAAKQGRAIAASPTTPRARPAPLVERIVAQLTDRDHDLKPDGAAWLACLRWRAGEEVDVPDDVAEVLDEMKGAGAGAPKGETKAPRAAKGKAA